MAGLWVPLAFTPDQLKNGCMRSRTVSGSTSGK